MDAPLGGRGYDAAAGEFSLQRFVPSEVDEAVRAFVRTYAAAADRDRLRTSLDVNDDHTLSWFAQRSVIAALRARDPALLVDAAHAVAAADAARMDPRERDTAAGLVSWALLELDVDAGAVLREAARLAPPATAEVLERFAASPVRDLSQWRHQRIETPDGPALVALDGQPYAPTVDLLSVGLRVCDAVEADGYRRAELTLRTAIPEIWVPSAAAALERVRAAASVSADLDPDRFRKAHNHMFVIWIAEADDAAVASTLAAAAKGHEGKAVLGLAESALCCVVVAGSTFRGVRPFESDDALRRFEPALRATLRDV